MKFVALDIGGTHARFAPARASADGSVSVAEPVTLKTDDYPGLAEAWAEFARRSERPPPRNAAIAIAAPVTDDTVPMTNNSWVIRQSRIASELGLDRVSILNDFAAVAHAAAALGDSALEQVSGPDIPLPAHGAVTVLGPGTGLGVAWFHRFSGGYHVQATEGGHIAFAPADELDDFLLHRLRAALGRVSVERVVSGPGLQDIRNALADRDGRAAPEMTDAALWGQGIDGADSLASEAVERFCRSLGGVAGDYALAHGSNAVILAGGIAWRLRRHLRGAGFASRFRAKGRYETMMASIPVKLLVHPQPGLLGAAAAFAKDHCP